MKMTNYQLYARILRLMTTYEDDCRLHSHTYDYHAHLYATIRDVIAADRTLVWC